jgi:mannose-6-phosphate isomerase
LGRAANGANNPVSDPIIYPLTFTPILRDYIWGGRRLETLYGRQLPPGLVAESWEISGHPSASTVAEAGYWGGQPLPAILADLGERLVGTRALWALERGKFPLLVKLLDARRNLSVQVHPGDAYAMAHEGGELGKTEMWYVLHADPGAELILGLNPGVTREAFREAARAGRVESLLRRIPVRAGQAVDVPTGTIHALLAGTVVTEIQQNSDTTYRVYDWGRVGADGKPRQLHIERALDVIDFAPHDPRPQPLSLVGRGTGAERHLPGITELVRNRYFVVEKVDLGSGGAYSGICDGSTLEIWGCMAGEAVIECPGGSAIRLPSIRYALLPAALGPFRVTAAAPSTCLRAYLPP